MPYDVLYLVPCPANLGGVMLVTPNAILHVDQTSRTVGIAVNGWANRSSSIVLPIQNGEDGLPLDLKLEGSRMSFVRDDSITLFLSDGTIRRVAVAVEGRTITKIEVSCPVVQSVPPSTVCVFGDHVFLGNTSGASVLLKASHLEEVVEKSATAPVQEDLDMDLDEGWSSLPFQPCTSLTGIKRYLWRPRHSSNGSQCSPTRCGDSDRAQVRYPRQPPGYRSACAHDFRDDLPGCMFIFSFVR